MSRHDRAQGGGRAHGAGGHAPTATTGHDDITNGHLAVQNLEGSTLFPRISVWAGHAIKAGNFPAAREAAMRWYSNRPYLRTLAQSLDPSDRFVARAQALLDDMAPLEAQLPDMLEIGFDPEAPHSRERWLARIGRAEKEKKQAQPEAAADAPPAVRSPLRPENVKSDGLDLGDLAAGALGAGAVLWADQHRDSINPVEHEVADVITKLTVNPAYTSGFVVGGIEGAWAALADNARLLIDIGEFFADMVKAQLINGGLGMLRELRDKIASMIAAGRQVPAAVKAFAERWNDASDPHAQGHFQGHAVGYVAVQILIILATELIPGGQYPGVVTALKLVADPVGGLAELGAAMKAARLARTAGKAAGKLEHAVEGVVAGERAGVRAAEGAAQGERRLGAVIDEANEGGRGAAASDVGAHPSREQPGAASTGTPNLATEGRPSTSHEHRPTVADDAGGGSRLTVESPWETGAKIGVEPTESSIRVGDVKMELHPDYARVVAEINQAGFDIRRTDKARVAVERIVDDAGEVIETRRFVEVIPGMRFLDLEHELGHVRQLEALGPGAPPTETIQRSANGAERTAKNELRGGTMSGQEDAVFEYHNRINEWIRLAERQADSTLLAEHARGVVLWRIEAENKLGRSGGRGRFDAWARNAVPDLPALEARARSLGLDLGRTTWRW